MNFSELTKYIVKRWNSIKKKGKTQKYVDFQTLDTVIYVCKSRDNLFEIARKQNVNIEELLTWNKLLPSQKLKKNQKIIILK